MGDVTCMLYTGRRRRSADSGRGSGVIDIDGTRHN